MVFSSLVFICLFLPAVLLLYYISKNITYRNFVLVLASLFFYAWGEPVWVILLVYSALIDYLHGRVIDEYYGRWQATAALISSITVNLTILAAFKYSGFIVQNVNQLLHTSFSVPAFSLPLGISFYTFQTMSYTIDLYRGNTRVQKSLLEFMTYVSMFPQLVAGPIVRYTDVAFQLRRRKTSFKLFSEGVFRFVCGLSKKVILANNAGNTATLLLGSDSSALAAASAWLGIVMYAFQIYFDFSGYSDMAIGLGKMLGFRFPENFNYPYIARSITDFWRRWHISLSSFFRDYVYIPLGGNRYRPIRNILVVWFLTGLWHGASWNFILWGVYYGIILLVEKHLFRGRMQRLPAPFCYLYSLVFILLGWSLFYFTDLSALGNFLKNAFCIGAPLYDLTTISVFTSNLWLILICIAASTPLPRLLYRAFCRRSYGFAAVSAPLLVAAGMAVCFILLVGQSYNPFLYFRF